MRRRRAAHDSKRFGVPVGAVAETALGKATGATLGEMTTAPTHRPLTEMAGGEDGWIKETGTNWYLLRVPERVTWSRDALVEAEVGHLFHELVQDLHVNLLHCLCWPAPIAPTS